MKRTASFLRQYLRPTGTAIETLEVTYRRSGTPYPATLFRPARRSGPGLAAWVVLHGLTYSGRAHPTLVRFMRAVAASGAAVLVPEVPEWRRLRVAPAVTASTISGAIDALGVLGHRPDDGVGVIGFSFGASQALNAVSEPRLSDEIAAVVAWGGYHDVDSLFRFGLTGEHELDGERFRLDPDPYGRWVMGGNYLTRIPGHERDGAITTALLQLAEACGRRGISAWDAVYDPLKVELRASLSPPSREVFDLFAPLTTVRVDSSGRALELSRALADAAVEADPLFDPRPRLAHVRTPTLLAHGRDDRLIPFTETLRLSRSLSPKCSAGCTVTSLFAHSGGATHGLGPLGLARETTTFVGLLNRILNMV